MQSYIERLTDGQDLSQSEARTVSNAVFEEATPAQIGALLAALRAKGETEVEIAGFAEGMREAARTIAPGCEPLVDTCGTGGDDYDTINVSTTSAIVVAGAGVPVAKHGNYSVSSSSGSADVLEELGVAVDAEPPAVESAIERDGIGFMLAQVFHPAMKAVIGPRRELGMRTIFNVLGPLTNPAGANAQVVGVYDPSLVPVVANALARMDVDHALVVHGAGTDEIAIHGETTVAEVTADGAESDGRSETATTSASAFESGTGSGSGSGSQSELGTVERYTIDPSMLGLEPASIDDIAGGTPDENADALEGIVDGTISGPKRDVVLANAGAAIYVAGEVASLEDGVEVAREAIDSGAAGATLDRLRGVTGEAR